MNTSKRSIRAAVVVAVGVVFFLLALVPLALAGETPSLQQTVQAGQTKVRNTQNAGRTSIALTGTAFKATSVAAQQGAKITATAYKLTATALTSNLQTTGTAVRANLNAAATQINATVVAVKTLAATKIVPVTDANAAIDYYSTTVLGTTSSLVFARNATLSDAYKLAQTEIGSQVQKYAVTYGAENYYGELSNGFVTLSYGVGAVINEELPPSLASASVAVYSLNLEKVGALNASSAFALAQTNFPKIGGLSYAPWTTPRGWAWVANDATGLLDTPTIRSTRSWIMLYVIPLSGGKAKVSVTVVTGSYLPFTAR